jgi:hypothetical protein
VAARKSVRTASAKRKRRRSSKVKPELPSVRKKQKPKPKPPPVRKKQTKPPQGLTDLGRRPNSRDAYRRSERDRKKKRVKKPLSRDEKRAFFRLGKKDPRDLARRAGVTEATVKRWKREGIPERAKKSVRTALDRSKASRRASTYRKVHEARREDLGHLHGKRRADRMLLQSMIDSSDRRYERFMKRMRKLGFSDKAARDEFFSPEVL